MALTFRSQNSIAYGSRNGTTCPAPAGIVDGDILICVCFVGRGTDDGINDVPTPSGWTDIGTTVPQGSQGSFYGRCHIWWKRAASESGDYAVVGTGATMSTEAVIAAYSGGLASGDVVDAFSVNSGTGASAQANSVTTTVANTQLIIGAHNWTAVADGVPSGFTSRFAHLVSLSDALQASAGASGNKTYTSTSGSGEPWAAWLVAIKSEPPAVPAVTFRSQNSITYGSRTSTTCPAPAGIVDGDILICICTAERGTDDGGNNLDTPAGWTAVSTATQVSDGSYYTRMHVWWRRAASESGSYLLTSTSNTLSTEAVIAAYSGAIASGSPVDVVTKNSGTGGTSTALTATTTVANAQLLICAMNWDGAGGTGTVSGFTERYDLLCGLQDAVQVSAGASGNKTYASGSTASYPWQSWLVALKPAVADPNVSVNVTGEPMTASVGTVSVSIPTGVSTSVTGLPMTASVGTPTFSLGQAISGIQYSVGAQNVGGYRIDEQNRDYMALGGYAVVPTINPATYVNVTTNLMTASVGTVSGVNTGVGVTAASIPMTLATAPVSVTVPLQTPVFRAVSNTDYAGRVGLTTITKPLGVEQHDILLAGVFFGAGADPGDATPPGGWAAVATSTLVNDGSFYGRFQVFWKRAGESEPASYDFTHAGSPSTQIAMLAYSGCNNPGNPFDSLSRSSGSGTTSTATSITTTTNNEALVWMGHCWDVDGSTPPTGFTERYDNLLIAHDGEQVTAGATGSKVMADNGNAIANPWQVWLFGLKPVQPTSGGDVLVGVSGNELAASVGTVDPQAFQAGPPTYRSQGSTGYAQNVNTSVLKPPGTIQNDIILLSLFWGQNGSDSSADPVSLVTPPAGFQPLAPSILSFSGIFYGRYQVWWKRAGASEPSSYSFTHVSLRTQALALSYVGATDNGSPIVALSTDLGIGITSTAQSITTTDNNATLVLLGHNWEGASLASPPTGFTERFDVIINANERAWLTAGPTGPVSHLNGNQGTGDRWQSWLLALQPIGTGDIQVEVTGAPMTAAVGTVIVHQSARIDVTSLPMTAHVGIGNVRLMGGMIAEVINMPPMTLALGQAVPDTGNIYIVQQAEGTQNAAALVTVTLPFLPRAGNLIYLGFSANATNNLPNLGWTQSAGMEQLSYQGTYGWWRIADGTTRSWQYTINAAVPSSWLLYEFANLDPAFPYDVSDGNFATHSDLAWTTPVIRPTKGVRLVLATVAGSGSPNLAGVGLINWTNGFVSIGDAGSNSGSYNNVIGMAMKSETTTGLIDYSTTATFNSEFTSHQPSSLIIAFQKRVVYAPVSQSAITASVGTVEVRTQQRLAVTGHRLEPLTGGFSVAAGGSINVRLTQPPATTQVGSIIVPMYNAWNPVSVTGPGTLSNEERILTTAPSLAQSTALSWEKRQDGLWYAEVTIGAANPTGTLGVYDPSSNTGTRLVLNTGQVRQDPAGTLTSVFSPVVANDVVRIAYDADVGAVWFAVNGGLWNNDVDQAPAGYDWPASHNTGYRNAPGYPGHLIPWPAGERPVANTRYEFYEIPGPFTTLEPGCTFYGCRFHGNWTDGWVMRVEVDEALHGNSMTTFQWCNFEPTNAVIPNAAWPSAGVGVNGIDGTMIDALAQYMIPYANSYQYGIMQIYGGIQVENCDIWGFGNSIVLFGSQQKTILRTWIHDASNPGTGSTTYHTDGPGHLDNSGCSNVLIKDCTIATFGNTNGIAFQTATIGYQDMIVRHNYLSGFGYCVDMGHNAPLNARLQFVNNVLATDINWVYGPLYNDFSAQFRQAGFVWSGNILSVYPGSQPQQFSAPKYTAADDGKFVLPSRAYSTTDFMP